MGRGQDSGDPCVKPSDTWQRARSFLFGARCPVTVSIVGSVDNCEKPTRYVEERNAAGGEKERRDEDRGDGTRGDPVLRGFLSSLDANLRAGERRLHALSHSVKQLLPF